jgi:DNA-binding transcriptional regulator YiaG
MAYTDRRESPMTPDELKTLRGDKTKIVFAAEIGATVQTLGNWESGRTKPPAPRLAQLQKMRDHIG